MLNTFNLQHAFYLPKKYKRGVGGCVYIYVFYTYKILTGKFRKKEFTNFKEEKQFI